MARQSGRRRLGGRIGVGAAALTAAAAAAQEPPAPLGARLGAFLVSPSMEFGTEYNDNVLEEDGDQIESTIFRISPELRVVSDFSRHAIGFAAGAEGGLFANSPDDDYLEYFAEGRGELDVTRQIRLNGSARYRRGSEGRESDDSPTSSAEPTAFDDSIARLRLDLDGNILRFAAYGSAQRLDFDSVPLLGGGVSDEDDRDRSVFLGGAEAGYEFLRGYEAFARLEARRIDYDEPLRGGGANRDGVGARALAGVNVRLTRLIEASVLGGAERRSFDDDDFSDFTDLAFEATASWSVTRLTTLRLEAERSIVETTVAGASHRVDSSYLLAAEHELRRDVTLEAALGFENRDFVGIDRDDDRLVAGMGLEWILARNLALEAEYRFTTQDSSSAGSDFDLNQVFAGLKYQF